MVEPVVGMVAHGTDGSDGIDPGVHLRWAFRREVGFPPGGFCLYRRVARTPPMTCFDFGRFKAGDRLATVTVQQGSLVAQFQAAGGLSIESARPVISPDLQKLRTEANLPPRVEGPELLLGAQKLLRVSMSSSPIIVIEALATSQGTLSIAGYAEGRRLAEVQAKVASGTLTGLIVRGERMNLIEVTGADVRVLRMCVVEPEACEDMKDWQPVQCPICLPVTRPGYACAHGHPNCDDLEARDRLPKDVCLREQYDGSNLDDLIGVLGVAVDPAYGPTMGSRFPAARTEADDCPPPGETPPAIGMSALDTILMAAVDPVIARVVGLAHIDPLPPAAQGFDYKIVGTWPVGTLWTLEHSVTFDEMASGRLMLPAVTLQDLAIAANRWSRIVPVPANVGRTKLALAPQAETHDWSAYVPWLAGPGQRISIRFNESVGEVQVYARSGGGPLRLAALLDGVEVDHVDGAGIEAVLAVHAAKIDSVVLTGDVRYLYRIDYGPDYIPHGSHCWISYGLRVGRTVPLPAPQGVAVQSLRGITRKKDDCEPVGEGEIVDARHLVGVRWATADAGILATDPLRFHVERESPDGNVVVASGDDPLAVARPDHDADAGAPPPPGWPKERSHFIDVLPFPGRYRYRVSGIDIFGRTSAFSTWATIDVAAVPPPPPASVSAKWLDPRDPFLTSAELSWCAGRAGVRVRWSWLASQERQSPFIDEFRLLLERGWLNVLTGTTATVPAAAGADGFKVTVAFARPLLANAIAGMTMTREGVPYRIRAHTATTAAPHTSELTCGRPNSGMPPWEVGTAVAVPLDAVVRARIDDVSAPTTSTRRLRVFIGDLRALPPAGFVGGTLIAGRTRWPVTAASGAVVSPNGVVVSLDIESHAPLRFLALGGFMRQIVTLQLPSGPPYADYRVPASWRWNAGSVPAEGPGDYAVFISEAGPGDALGRVAIGAREHRIVQATALLDPASGPYGQAALVTIAMGATGAASSASTFVRAERKTVALPSIAPPPDPAPDLPSIYASRPDALGWASYPYRWPRSAGMQYVVYRAMDETLFIVDRQVRGARSKNRADWNAFLLRFDDPDTTLRDRAFELFINAAAPPDYHTLVPKNRLLEILASFPDVAEAFARLNTDPIAADVVANQDRMTEVPGPGAPPFVAAAVCLYFDHFLPGRGKNAFFYRVRTIDASGNATALSRSTQPVHLRAVAPPAMPTIVAVTPGDSRITIAWASNREPDLTEYAVLRADTELAAATPAQMTSVHVELVPPTDPPARPARIEWTDNGVVPGRPYWYRLQAATNAARVSGAPLKAQALEAPPPQIAIAAALWRAAARPVIEVSWAPHAGVEVRVQRRAAGGRWRASNWMDANLGVLAGVLAEDYLRQDLRLESRRPGGATALGPEHSLAPVGGG